MATSNIPRTSGIYIISNSKNGKVYIGKAADMKRRWKDHKSKLNSNQHYNPYLQNAWNKYGAKTFKFLILERCPIDELDEREKHYIAIYKPKGLSYNLTDGGDGRMGLTHSIEARLKISLAHRGSGNPNFGKSPSEETRDKLSDALKGDKNHNFGKPRSAEVRAKISEAKKGKKLSMETRKKMSKAHSGENNHMYGKHHSEDTKAKISASEKGKVNSPEARAKMSEAHQKRKLNNE